MREPQSTLCEGWKIIERFQKIWNRVLVGLCFFCYMIHGFGLLLQMFIIFRETGIKNNSQVNDGKWKLNSCWDNWDSSEIGYIMSYCRLYWNRLVFSKKIKSENILPYLLNLIQIIIINNISLRSCTPNEVSVNC